MAVRKRDVIGSVGQVSTRSEAEPSARKKSAKTKVRWQDSGTGKVVIGILSVVLVLICVLLVKSYLHGDTPGDPNTSMFVDSQTGLPFPHTNAVGETVPIVAPSGGNTGYPGVPCYWTASGEIKKQPTWVLMNSWVGKRGPTFCPDCGRLVDPTRPVPPQPGDKPPPTQQEMLHASPSAGKSDR